MIIEISKFAIEVMTQPKSLLRLIKILQKLIYLSSLSLRSIQSSVDYTSHDKSIGYQLLPQEEIQ